MYSLKTGSVLIIGDFNVKSCNWSINDIATPKRDQIDSVASLYEIKQHISELTHSLEHSSRYIDLYFTKQPNIVIDSGVDSSLRSKYNHQIIYSNSV